VVFELSSCTTQLYTTTDHLTYVLAKVLILITDLYFVTVVLENSNVAKLASTLYLSVHSLPQEDCYDTDDASAREIYPILVPESTL